MSLDTKVKNLIINTNMTKEQYEAIDDKSNQLFFVEDSSVVDVPAPEENQSGYLHTDGANLTWEEIESGDKLPDQTGNAGKFLQTDGTMASWGEALVNSAVADGGVGIGKDIDVQAGIGIGNSVKVDHKNNIAAGRAIAIGAYAEASTGNSHSDIAIGQLAKATGSMSIAIGAGGASATAQYAIQLGKGGKNGDANTLKIANENGNFEMMDANGNIPLDRLTYVTDQIGDISTVLDSINGETLEG